MTTFFSPELTRKNTPPLVVYLLFLSILELLAYHKGEIFSIIASRLWLATALFCLLLFTIVSLKTLWEDIRRKRIFLILGYALLLALFCNRIGSLAYSDVSYEAALQAAAGLNSFEFADLNYTGVAFLDYANRQYIINALPALLFGRSILTLHLGFALPFLIGMTLLYLELRSWLRSFRLNEAYALLPLYALPVFPYITEYFMNFEQTLTPVAYTMLGLALLLHFYRNRDIPGVLALSFVGGMCCNAYTPVLAFFGFLLFFLIFWIITTGWQNRRQLFSRDNRSLLWQLLLCLALITKLCCYFAATLITRQKEMITTIKPDLALLSETLVNWFDFFTDRHGLFWGIWLLMLLLYLLFALLGFLKLPHFFVAGWMLLTVFFSGTLAGYTTYEKAHEIQRNMLIIPVFVTAVFFVSVGFFRKHPVRPPKALLPATLAVLLLLGQFNFCREHHSFVYYRHIQSMKYMLAYSGELLDDTGLSNTDPFRLVLLTDNLLLGNLSDYTAFFYPNAEVLVASPDAFAAGVVPESDSDLPTLVFCETLPAPGNDNYSIVSQSFDNKRYDTTVTWYCLLLNLNLP